MKLRIYAAAGLLLSTLITGFFLWRSSTSKPVATNREVRIAAAPLAAPTSHENASPAVAVAAPTAAPVFSAAWQQPSIAAMSAFKQWTERYLAAPVAQRANLAAEGRALAEVRRTALADLIRHDPRAALENAVPMVVRQNLPAEIVAQLEQRVSGIGELAQRGVTPAPGAKVSEPTYRAATIGDTEYRAFVYGRREAYATVGSTSMVGIAVDGLLAVGEEPLRVLEAGEKPATRPIKTYCTCGAQRPASLDSAMSTSGENLAVEFGGIVQVACSPEHVQRIAAALLAAEVSPRTAADSGAGTSGVVNRPAQSWTHGTKKILVIRVDFSDFSGTPVYPSGSVPITDDYVVNLFNNSNGIADFYAQGSFSKTALSIAAAVSGESPDVTPVYRMPNTGASYATGGSNSALHSDAQALATSGGYDMNTYDRIVVVFPNLSSVPGTQITYGGLGDIEGKKTWINGWFDFRVVAHEIGHNYGLPHANLWQVSDGNPVSPTGSSTEYGDSFDVMGLNGDITLHFSHWNKSLLQWIPDTAVTTVQSSGTYRVYRFDDQAANLANARALKIVRDSTRDYWIGYRRATSNANLDGGAYVLWGYNESQQGNLLDMTTPGASTSDAALAVGASFNDSLRGITIAPVAQGGSGAEEYLDVQITLAPLVSWSTASVTVGEPTGSITLNVSRSRNASGAVSVNYATASGTATSGTDFTATSGTLTWNDGDTSTRSITIPLAADSVSETSEDFTVTLSSPSGAVLSDDSAVTVSILDAGVRDPAFAADFINNSVEKILALPDGSMVLGGWFNSVQDAGFTNYTRKGITKISATGTLDTSFASGGGIDTTPVYDMALQPDGKIVIVGAFTTVHGTTANRIARLNADGSLDSGFNPGTGANGTAYAVLLQPDGKIVVGGAFTTINGTAREYLARLNADGSLDTTFVGPDFGTTTGWRVENLAMQSDGKLIVAGQFYFSSTSFKSGICRVSATGALDSTFSGVVEGAHLAGATSSLRSVSTVSIQPDGKILIGGAFTAFNNTARGGLARLNSDGSLDSTFAPTTNGNTNSIVYLADGRVLAGGTFTTMAGVTANRVALLSSTGTISTGSAEEAFAAKGGHGSTVRDLILLANGTVVLGSDFGSFQGATPSRPIWTFAGPAAGTPGSVQFAATVASGTEGNSAVLTVSRSGSGLGALTVGYATLAGTAGASDFTAAAGVLTWANGDVANKTITVPLASDATSDAGEVFTVQLGQPLGGGAILGANQLATVTINEPLTGYAAFNAANFTTGELTDSAISGANADPDVDGLANIIEYALGLNPKAGNTTGIPTTSVAGSDWVFTYVRPTSTTDLVYSVEYSLDLTSWTTVADAVIASASGTETREARVAQSVSSKLFFRLKVVR